MSYADWSLIEDAVDVVAFREHFDTEDELVGAGLPTIDLPAEHAGSEQ